MTTAWTTSAWTGSPLMRSNMSGSLTLEASLFRIRCCVVRTECANRNGTCGVKQRYGPRVSYDDDLRLAHVIADQVDAVTLSRFTATDLVVETKPDLTPVTDADRAAEQLIRNQLKRTRPRDAVLGEEFGSSGRGDRRWIIDPIDGTKNFVRGVPVWATLIALVDGDSPVLGVVSAPALGRRWWAAQGTGAWTGRSLSAARRLRVSGVQELSDASLSYASL